MTGLAAPVLLVAARMRRRPGRWLVPALGIAVAAAFATGVAAEATVVGDQSARAVLTALTPVDSSVRVTWQGAATPQVGDQARRLLSGLGLGAQTQVVLLNPVRLSGLVVRPAAIAPLARWLAPARLRALGPCRELGCPMIDASAAAVPATLATPGARIRVVGSAPLSSAAPLGFSPVAGGGPPVLLSADPGGLARIPGLSGVYRTYDWVAPLAVARLHSWQLAAVEARLQRSQASLQATEGAFSLTGPFDALDRARAQAAAAPRRLLLAGGGAVAALALFVVLAAAGLRRDQQAEVRRLRRAGARSGQCVLLVIAEAAWLSAAALLVGAGIGVAGASALIASAGEPVVEALAHSLITPAGAASLAGAWVAATGLMSATTLTSSDHVIDVLAAASVVAVAVGLALGSGGGSFAALVAPLCCLAAGVVVLRIAGSSLRAGERLLQRGPVRWRLALVGLARAPALPSAAIAFVAVSVGLGGFALAYRATVVRSAADRAADQVPLDASISAGPGFTTPLELAPVRHWGELARGPVFPVQRTDANYTNGGGTVTVPAIGLSAAALPLIHGWRASDGSAALAILARRLAAPGPVRNPGPELPAAAASLVLAVSSPGGPVAVTADLRDPSGAVTQVQLGSAGAGERTLRARVPRGTWELEALELTEPTGLEATNGHQNAESPSGAIQQQSVVRLGPLLARSRSGRTLLDAPLDAWRAVGAAAPARPASGTAGVAVLFTSSGEPGVVRPVQPSDGRALPVLTDPQTAAAAGPGGRVAMTVDGLPVITHVVGVLRRFPTVPATAGGFVVADQAALSSALDAQMPGQGRPDELWVSSGRLGALAAALARPPFTRLSVAYRDRIEHGLRAEPLARAATGVLIAAAAAAAALAVLGLLVSMLGSARDRIVERDLETQGLGPAALRSDLRARLAIASIAGVCAGVVIALLLLRLAVAAVRAGATVADPRPALVAIVPVGSLALWALGVATLLIVCASLAARAARWSR